MTMRARFVFRTLAVVAVLMIGVPGIAVAILALRFNPNDYKPEIVEAVRRATGREIDLTGKLHVRLGLHPRIEAHNVTFANVAGGSRPAMASVDRIEAQIALLPLLHRTLAIDRLHIVRPDILLETDKDGQPNWRFTPDAQSKPVAAAAPPEPARPVARRRMRLFVSAIQIDDGVVTWRNGRTGRQTILGLRTLSANADSAETPLQLALTAAMAGTDIHMVGTVGPLGRLRDGGTAPPAPWPIDLRFTALGAETTIAGTIDDPNHPDAYALTIILSAPELAALSPLAAGIALPRAQSVRAQAQVTGHGRSVPQVAALTLSAGRTDLSTYAPGLTFDRLVIAAPAADRPAHAEGAGSYAGVSFSGSADTGPLAALLSGSIGPLQVAWAVQAAGAHLTAKGTIGAPRALTGVDLAVAGAIPDLGLLAPLLGGKLPSLSDLTFAGHLGDTTGGLDAGVRIDRLHVAAAGNDVTADVTATWRPRATFRGRIAATSLDVRTLAALSHSRPASPAQPPYAPAATPSAPATALVPTQSPRRVFSDRPLPFARLLAFDADLDLVAATITDGGEVARNLTTHLALAGGKLALNPFAADLPAGHLDGSFSADAALAAPPMHLVLHAPGIATGPLFALFGQPPLVSGAAELDADLSGAGDTARAVAATLDGHLGIAMVGGSIDMRDLAEMFAEALRRARLPGLALPSGATPLRCLAARLDFVHGVAALRTFALDAPPLAMGGDGSINLTDETLALRLHPTVSLGRFGAAVPVDVTGPITAPHLAINASGAAGDAGRSVAGHALGGTAGLVIGALVGNRGAAGAEGQSCDPALASARGGRPGPASPAAEPQAPDRRRPADILRRLLP